MALTKQDPKIDGKGNQIIKVLELDAVTGYPKRVVIKDQQQKKE